MSPTVYRPATPDQRTSLRSHPERGVPEEAPAILSAGLVAHVGFAVGDQPYVMRRTTMTRLIRGDSISMARMRAG